MSKDMVVVHFNIETESSSDLISGIKSLGTVPRRSAPEKPAAKEESSFLLSSVKKKDGKKKKKKEKEDLQLMMGGSLKSTDDLSQQADEFLGIIDVDDLLYREDESEDISDGIISEQKRNYDRNRKEENPFRKEFAESEALMYELLEETKKFGRELDKEYKAMSNSRTRGTPKMKSELINSILTSKTTQLSIIKEISSIKKTVQDLNIKANQKNKDAESTRSNEAIAASYLQQIIGGHGRADFIKELGGGSLMQSSHEQQIEDAITADLTSGVSPTSFYNDSSIDYSEAIEERLEELGNPNRSEEADRQILFEKLGAKIVIRRFIDSNDWEFIAVDEANREIAHYPVPNPDDIGRIKFSSDGTYAVDGYGRTYRVIESFDNDGDDD